MVSFRDRMLAKTADLPNAKDIKVTLPLPGTEEPVTAVGTMVQLGHAKQQLGAATEKIAALEEKLLAMGASTVIPVDQVRRNPWQPRIKFDPLKLTELAESIKEIGQLQPVLVRRKMTAGGEFDYYELIAGERRWRAHLQNGMTEIMAVVTKASDADMAIMALAENISRDDLDDYEISKSVRLAEKEFKKRAHLAEALGISRGNMYRFFAFGELPEFITADLEEEPGLLGGNAANEIAKVLKRCRDSSQEELARAEELATEFWQQLKAGSLDQGKFATVLDGALQRRETGGPAPSTGASAGESNGVTASREIRKVFAGKAQAGSITKDGDNFVVKLKSSVLTPAKEERIRNLIDELFSDDKQ